MRQRPLEEIVAGIGEGIDLVTVDVEGAEYDIVMGSDSMMVDATDRIVVGYDAVDPKDTSLTVDTLARHLTSSATTSSRDRGTTVPGHGS